MRLKLIVIIGICLTGIIESKGQTINTFSISGGIGMPTGITNYPQNNLADAALFSNYGHAIQIGIDVTFKSSRFYGMGIFTSWNKYVGWDAKNLSNRYVNATLSSLDVGPLFYFNVPQISNNNRKAKFLVVPCISFVHLVNKDSLYSVSPSDPNIQNASLTLSIQKNESISSLSQLLPGIYIGFEWSVYISENASICIRPGLTYKMTKPVGYPDKYVCMPSVSIGYTFDYSRNKWFFIKNVK